MLQRKMPFRLNYNDLIIVISIINSIGIGLKGFKEYSFLFSNEVSNKIENHIDYIFSIKNTLICEYEKGPRLASSICLTPELLKQINIVFEIEMLYKSLSVKIWQYELTKIENYNEQEHCKLLVHSIRNDDSIDDKLNILDRTDIGFISTSLLYNDERNRAFSTDSDYGLIYDINILNFLGACESDAVLHQGTSSCQWITNHSYNTLRNEISGRCINSSRNAISINYYQMVLTKTPYTLLNSVNKNMDSVYNEVGILKKYSMPKAVIQFYYGKPFVNRTMDKSLILAEKYKTPIIYRKKSNEIKTLDEFSDSIERYYIAEALNKIIESDEDNPVISLYKNENKVFEYYRKMMMCNSKEEAKAVLRKSLNN